MPVLDAYKALETRLVELSPESRDCLLYQLVGAISVGKNVRVSQISEAVTSLESQQGGEGGCKKQTT